MVADEDLHRHAVENLNRADALLFGRVTYEMMEAGWLPPAQTGARPDWMEPFARTIDAAKKYVVSSTLDRVDWNAELVRGDLGKAVQQLKRESGRSLTDVRLRLQTATFSTFRARLNTGISAPARARPKKISASLIRVRSMCAVSRLAVGVFSGVSLASWGAKDPGPFSQRLQAGFRRSVALTRF